MKPRDLILPGEALRRIVRIRTWSCRDSFSGGALSDGSIDFVGVLLVFIPTYIFIAMLLWDLHVVNSKPPFLHEYLSTYYADSDKMITSLQQELEDPTNIKIGNTLFTKHWMVSKTNSAIDYFANYNNIEHIRFGLYSSSLNFIPVQHTYTLYAETDDFELGFEVGVFKRNCEKATELITKRQDSQGKGQVVLVT